MAEILPRFRRFEQQIEDEKAIAKILLETGEAPDGNGAKLLRRSADGHDPARLRGLPAIGRNVAGCMRNTDPLREVLRKEARGELYR